VESWKNIVWIDGAADGSLGINWTYAVGLKEDGTVVSSGDGDYYTVECNLTDGYINKYHADGKYNNVSSWKLWE